MQPNKDSSTTPTEPDGGSDQQTTPPPGPPQKGFWGFLASFFPKQHPIAGSPSPSSVAGDPSERETPSNQSSDLLNRPAPTIKPDHDPQPLAIPPELEAEPIEADGTKVSPTLPTQEPAAGEPASETAPGQPKIQ